MKRLCYVFPDGQMVRLEAHDEEYHWRIWMYGMVEACPEIIFFYTVETTDID